MHRPERVVTRAIVRALSYGASLSEQPGLQRYYQTLREHVWLIAACVCVAVLAAVAYVELAPQRYRAQSEMLVSPVPADNPALFGLPLIHSTNDPTRDVLTAASLVTTNQVAAAVIRTSGLHTATGALLANVQATPLAASNLVTVQADASSGAEAQRLANAFAQQTIATRTAALHAALANIVPGLRARVAQLPAGQRNGPGSLGDQLTQLELLQTANDPTVQIATPADLPTGPFSPRKALSIAAGLFAGLILGIGAAFAYHALDPRLQREEQLRQLFGAQLLARIPWEGRRREHRPLLPAELSIAAQEGYRTLRTTVTSRGGSQRSRAFLVTGSAPSEGKTTTAISLAVTLAQGGARVILIEADLRRPTLAATLGLDTNYYGTEQVLIGELDLADALTSARFAGTLVHVLAVRRAGVSLADRLSIPVARRLVEDAKKLADYVVIDSPPLTAVIDALPLAQMADEVIVVARLGHSSLAKLSELNTLLLQHDAGATGFVVVGVSKRVGNDYYYSPNNPPSSPSNSRRTEQREPARGSSPRSPN